MKPVLLICPRFFGYYQSMCRAIRSLGYEVDWYDDLPNQTSLPRALGRLSPNLIKPIVHSYFRNMMQTVQGKKYGKVILVYSMSFCYTQQMMMELRACQQNAEFVLYAWDAFTNLRNTDWLLNCFDRCYSFEPEDVQGDDRLKLLPLFYTDAYDRKNAAPAAHFDFFYYGTAHPQKLLFIDTIAKQLRTRYQNVFIKHYLPSKLKYIYHKLQDTEVYREYRFSDFTTQKLSMEQMAKYVCDAACILDAPQKGQQGLTMRSIECLGARRKLITANKGIKAYDFYTEQNIYVCDGALDFEHPFFNTPYQELSQSVYQRYSIGSWVKVLLNIT